MTDFQMSLRRELDAMFQSFSRSITWATEGENETFYHRVFDEGKAQIIIQPGCRMSLVSAPVLRIPLAGDSARWRPSGSRHMPVR
jgi:hypothetical protein